MPVEDLGPIGPYLASPDVAEIMVNGPANIFIEQAGRLIQLDKRYSSEMELQRVVRLLLTLSGKTLNPQVPLMDTRLSDGSRMTVTMPPVTTHTTFTIRRSSARPHDLSELVMKGTLSNAMAEFLRIAVQVRLNILIAGGTSSGKTTLLNSLASGIPRANRIVTLEDTYEISLPHTNWIALETVYQGRGGGDLTIDLRALVAHALHLRPDRVLLGEVRGPEALDMLQAMNSGHDGSMATIHANSPQDVISRLETLVLMAGYEIPVPAIRQQIARALNLIIQMRRTPEGVRQISAITEITGYDNGHVVLNDIFLLARNRDTGQLDYFPTGYVPAFIRRVSGVTIPPTMFGTPQKTAAQPS